VQEPCSYTCLAEVLQESREPNQELYDAIAVNLIDVTHVSLPMSVKYSEVQIVQSLIIV
jgi:predicted HTH domain antitoxin